MSGFVKHSYLAKNDTTKAMQFISGEFILALRYYICLVFLSNISFNG